VAEQTGAVWVTPLRGPLGAESTSSVRALVHGDAVVCWGAGLVRRFDGESGKPGESARIKGATFAGFDDGGAPVFRGAENLVRVDLSTLDVAPLGDRRLALERGATDAPEAPEEEPFLLVGRRRYRARLETKSRVTRHHLEICDEGHPPRELEIASYTLRSDRLALWERSPGRVLGSVGMEPECPVACFVGLAHGPVVLLRRRYSAWHEHGIGGGPPDLVGHGDATVEITLVPEGHEPPRSKRLGTLSEEWTGLERRASVPARPARATGLVPIGTCGEHAVVEVRELELRRSTDDRLTTKRRALAAYSLADLC
jgi:hypothetical protein